MPMEVHRSPCAHCPSAHHPPDPEALDLLKAPRSVQVQHAFPCGWRPHKLCKGYCDSIAITERELAAYSAWRAEPGWGLQATEKPFPSLESP